MAAMNRRRHSQSKTVAMRRWIAFAGACGGAVATLLLAGCGTNVRWLVERNGTLTREADWLAAEAGEGLVEPVLAAESERTAACAEIDHAAMQRLDGEDPTFVEQLLSDLAQVAVLIVPVGDVERCAEAQRHYEAAVAALARRLERTSADMAAAGAAAPQ